MEFYVKKFQELTNDELYEIFKIRVSVFVVEQNCPYQEIDEYDKDALHLFFRENGKITTYLRVLPRNTVFEEVSIGRVLSVNRRKKRASDLLEKGIEAAYNFFNAEKIEIEAQTYVKKLYENKGFRQISDEFFEDSIPHVKMELIK